ncbi:MAG: c-type cytochrome [Acidobacteriota bacterium]|nr:c-type cytochrome [Acidobacteriota bacterium]
MRCFAAITVCAFALTSCTREKREVRPAPARVVVFRDAARESDLQPGGTQSIPQDRNPYHGEAYAISEGARLFDWYNCSGCHAHGGGGIGPPLIKDEWIYGGEAGNLFDTIVKGRPNGMPTWGGRIPEYQIWQLAAYVRSLNGKQPQSATPARTDTIEQDPGTIKNQVQGQTK